MKVDDDVFVNPENLWTALSSTKLETVKLNHSNGNIEYALIGKVHPHTPVLRDVREGSIYILSINK